LAYDLKPVKAPRLTGAGLLILARVLEGRVLSKLVVPKLHNDLGMPAFRARPTDAVPRLQPFVAPDERARSFTSVGIADIDHLAEGTTVPRPGFAMNTIQDFARAYRGGQTTPGQVAMRAIRAIEDSNSAHPPLRAIIKSKEEDILSQARASTERFRAGRPLSILDGVPVAVKDEIDQVPYSTGVGTRIFGTEPVKEDATVVARLRAAGALLIGKANMHEIGIGVSNLNPHTGFARNPFNPNHITGGSSGGSGAATAAGLAPVAMGADGGGSVRIPAALCGVVGLKGTFARVSEQGAFPLCWSVAHVGPLATSALDCAIAYAITAGPDPRDPWSTGGPPVHLTDFANTDLSDVRLGVYEPWFRDADPGVVHACETVLNFLRRCGAKLVSVDLPDLDPVRIAHAITASTEMANAMQQVYDRGRQREFSAETRINLALAQRFTSRDYLLAQRVRTEAIANFRAALSLADVIITPTTACTAPPIRPNALPHGESDLSMLTEIMRFSVFSNFTGLPAISFPAGYDQAGLPIGFQAIGRWWEEHLLLRIAHTAEHGVERRKPAIHYDLLETR
jgi:Asp-tRNA(Asn)/Glu-tRNA(Gln) amidotransferase A subunit family amidase